MAGKVSFDTSELRTLAADMHAIPERFKRHVYPVVERGANNIKREIRANFEASTHFRPVARTVRYEMSMRSAFGTGSVEAEIGPMPRGSTGMVSRLGGVGFNEADFEATGGSDASTLAHIAIYGSPRGGGGTVADPVVALDNEAPNFERALGDLLEDVL